ncbi:hypothetical protein [Ulvibacterium marinum]|uniref:hypothetical protein n=1 Tax=Ulvibacterium marinum TaxID=2419782 RepID=UPI002494A5F1|nr:hypothetical protein [Ulvibacterium marinum]
MSKLRKENELRLIKEIAISKNGVCLSTVYINSKSKLHFKCREGHKWWATSSKIKMGRWCPECGGSKPLTIELMNQIAKERGGYCLSKEYINGKTKLQWQCKNGHVWWAVPSSIRNGSWCQICQGNYKHNIQMMQDIAISRGGKCLSKEYINNSSELQWECSDGHVFTATPNRVRSSGRWCPICSSSLGERICRVLFEQIFNKKFPKAFPDWLINEDGNRMELDGYCSELNIAFEHQGEQHYTLNTHFIKSKEKLNRRIRLDKQKEKLCKSNGITLIAFPEIKTPLKIIDLKKTLEYLLKENGISLPNDFASKVINIDEAYISKNLDELIDLAKLNGGEYCEKVYKGALEPVEWKCSCGNNWHAAPTSIKGGSWCPVCSYKDRAEAKRLNIAELHKIAHKHGGKCLSTKHINTQTKLLWECKNGHRWEATPGNVLSGKWCKKCAGIEKLTIDEMRDIAKSRGGKCLSDEYVNARTKLIWQCSEGHIWKAIPSSIKQGHWCGTCTGNNKKSLSEIKKLALKKGGYCLSEEYINSGTNLKWQCSKGHIWEATYDNVKRGTWCIICSRKSAGIKRRLTITEMNKIAQKRGGKCLSEEYTNTQTKLPWECRNGHQWEATPGNIKNGRWCPTCALNKKTHCNKV